MKANSVWYVGAAAVLSLGFFGFLLVGVAGAAFTGSGGGGEQQASTSSGTVSCEGLKEQPPEYSDYVCAAGQKFKVDPAFLLAILYYEHRGTYKLQGSKIVSPKDPINLNWASSGVAFGPAQFIPSTWASAGQDGKKFRPGDGGEDGRKDIDKWSDALFGSANYLSQIGGKPKMTEQQVKDAACRYNGGPGCSLGIAETADYVEGVARAWKLFGGGK